LKRIKCTYFIPKKKKKEEEEEEEEEEEKVISLLNIVPNSLTIDERFRVIIHITSS
jgi:hypothetical protein